jgi:hypothetical protein
MVFDDNLRRFVQVDATLAIDLQRKPIDIITLAQALNDSGKLDSIGGGGYLFELLDFPPTSANVGHYCHDLPRIIVPGFELVSYDPF